MRKGVEEMRRAAQRAGRASALVATVLSGVFAVPGGAQTATTTPAAAAPVQRAIPAPMRPPAFFRQAMERRTRTVDGSPGASYWQNWSTYDVEARLDPETGRVTGSVSIRYENRSPYRLPGVFLHLHQNLHTEGAARNEAQEITGGMVLNRVSVDGRMVSAGDPAGGPAYEVEGTVLSLRLFEPLEPGDTVTVNVGWENVLPQNGAGRMGHSDREMYFAAYWFPKMAVFDDLRGWDAQPYLGGAEFYDGFGDYTLSLSVPSGWTAMATGQLQNPDEVFSARTVQRLAEAATSDERVVVASTEELAAGTVTTAGSDGWLTYRFVADSVRDVAWTTSNVQRWDATSAVVAEDRVAIHSFWREDRAPLWAEQWLYGKQSIEFHSEYTGLAYPWPHMTSVEGADIIGGGMEFPMMMLIGPYTDQPPQDLFNVTSHEIAHMWIPMIVGTNEKRYAWMDEGSTSFLENQSRMALWPGVDHHRVEAQTYLAVAAAGLEQSMMRHGDWYEPGPGYGVASYPKPAALMVALRELVMDPERWVEAYRTFIDEWAWKHPTPWDFFNTFERFAERDLDWFWTSFYEETWRLDHAVDRVETRTDGSVVIHVVDRGDAPFPAVVRIRTAGEGVIERRVEVDHWLAGNTTARIELPASVGRVSRVELNPSGYAPDADRTNDFWPRG